MDVVTDILLVLHLVGLVLCVGTAFSLARARPVLTAAEEGQQQVLFSLGRAMGENGLIGLALLWATGPMLLWVNFTGPEMFNVWLLAKIVAVIAMSVCIFATSSVGQRLHSGDMSVAPILKRYGRFNVGLGLVIVAFSALAFS